MNAKPLCIRTFCESVQTQMKKKSVIKNLTRNQKLEETGQKIEDASGDFVFYTLVLKSLTHAYTVDPEEKLSDISKQLVSYLKNGHKEVPSDLVAIAQSKDIIADVSTYFAINLVPNIADKASLTIVLDALDALIQNDTSLGPGLRKHLKKLEMKEPLPIIWQRSLYMRCAVEKTSSLSRNTRIRSAKMKSAKKAMLVSLLPHLTILITMSEINSS